MIGGLNKTASRVAIAAALLGGSAMLTSAYAADLGGDCCADLEERVAELEATAVKKGNRNISMTISGSITEGVLFWDDGYARDKNVIVPDAYGAGLKIAGEGKIHSDLKAGYVIALDVRYGDPADADNNANATGQYDPLVNDGAGSLQQYNVAGKIAIDKQYVYLSSGHMGTLSIGKRDDVYDSYRKWDASIVDMAAGVNVRNAAGAYFNGGDSPWGNYLGGVGAYNGMILRYDTPAIAGFAFGVSWGNDDTFTTGVKWDGNVHGNTIGVSYGYLFNTTGIGFEETRQTFGAKVANDHSGLFAQFAYETWDTNLVNVGPETAWQIKAGVSKNYTGMGNTSLAVIYQQTDNRFELVKGSPQPDIDASGIGVELIQTLDPVGADLILRYDHRQIDTINGVDNSAWLDSSGVFAGMRVKF